MFDLADDWVWDFWVVDDPDTEPATYHLFFLKAPRSLGDPDLRHVNASIGHAVSDDLVHWTRVADALDPQPAPAFDDLATWTGCIVRGVDGLWRMFSTGVAGAERGSVQRVGLSTSADLLSWTRRADLLLEADERWYGKRAGAGPDEHWRDPWVVQDAEGLWHMYLTAQTRGDIGQEVAGQGVGHGVVGHATSPDLHTWTVGPPLSAPTGRFDQLEVMSLHVVEGRWVLLFSCLAPEMPGAEPNAGGIWSVPIEGPGASIDVARAVRVTSEALYVGKLIDLRDGGTRFLAFQNFKGDGCFVGGVIDPCPVIWNDEGTGLRLIGVPEHWLP